MSKKLNPPKRELPLIAENLLPNPGRWFQQKYPEEDFAKKALTIIHTTNHKTIGSAYLVFGFVAGLLGALYSFFIRLELAQPGSQIFSNHVKYAKSI